jgi:hypothetical protein
MPAPLMAILIYVSLVETVGLNPTLRWKHCDMSPGKHMKGVSQPSPILDRPCSSQRADNLPDSVTGSFLTLIFPPCNAKYTFAQYLLDAK